MEYKKISKGNYNFHLIKNERFKTINVDVYFTSLYDKSVLASMNLLVKILTYSTKKYSSKNKLAIQSEKLYNALISSRFMVIGNISSLLMTLEFIDPVYTEDSMYEESFNFLKEVLFNPNIVSDSFEEEIFNLNKENMKREIGILLRKPNVIAFNNYSKEMYKGTSGSTPLMGKIEDYDKISSKELYSFYKNILGSSKIDIIVMGNVNEKRIETLVDKLFGKLDNKGKQINNIYPTIKIKEKPFIKKESYNYNQSILMMGYKFNNINEYELKYVLSILNIILGTMNNSVLFTKVREECSYCYNITSFVSRFNTSLTIQSGINKKNYENVVKKVKECIHLLKDEHYIKSLFNTALKTANTYLNDYYDNTYSIMEHYYINEFDAEDDVEVRREVYSKMTPKDVVNLAKKMVLDTIYFMEGTNEEY